MKKIWVTLVMIYASLTPVGITATGVGRGSSSASDIEDADDGGYVFTTATESLVKNYGKTADPSLPEPDTEAWALLESPSSAAPGRQRVPRNIVVDKPHTTLYVITAFGDTLFDGRVCASLKRGQKKKRDDWRTPEGDFRIMGIYNSTDWTYQDTGDKCYGPYFISLITPGFTDIGIHGTNAPYSVPGRRSHGCMRMHNDKVTALRTLIHKDSHIIVLPDPEQPGDDEE